MDFKNSIKEAKQDNVVRLNDFDQVMEYFRAVNQMKLDDVVLIGGDGKRIIIDEDILEEWKYVGLSNRNFFEWRVWSPDKDNNNEETK
jgi:hypothetical protein